MAYILRFILSLMLFFSTVSCYTMNEVGNNIKAEEIETESDTCACCHGSLIDDLLDLPCHSKSHGHKKCYKEWVLHCLEKSIVPTCMLCRSNINPNMLGINYDSLSEKSKATFAAAMAKQLSLMLLERVVSYQNITNEDCEIAQKMHNSIKEMSIEKIIKTGIIQSFNLEYLISDVDCFEKLPQLREALKHFEKLKNIQLQSSQQLVSSEIRGFANLKVAIVVIILFTFVEILVANDIPVHWDTHITVLIGLTLSMTLYSLR